MLSLHWNILGTERFNEKEKSLKIMQYNNVICNRLAALSKHNKTITSFPIEQVQSTKTLKQINKAIIVPTPNWTQTIFLK